MYVSTRYHTPAALMLFLTSPSAALLPVTTKTTDDAVISPFCLLSLMVQGFASHRTWVGIVMPSFSASNYSRIFCRPSVPFPMYRTRGTACVFTLSQVSFPSTSTTPLLTVLAAAMMKSHLRCRILVRDCRDCALRVPPCVHDPNVGRGLLVEQRSVDR